MSTCLACGGTGTYLLSRSAASKRRNRGEPDRVACVTCKGTGETSSRPYQSARDILRERTSRGIFGGTDDDNSVVQPRQSEHDDTIFDRPPVRRR